LLMPLVINDEQFEEGLAVLDAGLEAVVNGLPSHDRERVVV
jgi:hypothetical protein